MIFYRMRWPYSPTPTRLHLPPVRPRVGADNTAPGADHARAEGAREHAIALGCGQATAASHGLFVSDLRVARFGRQVSFPRFILQTSKRLAFDPVLNSIGGIAGAIKDVVLASAVLDSRATQMVEVFHRLCERSVCGSHVISALMGAKGRRKEGPPVAALIIEG